MATKTVHSSVTSSFSSQPSCIFDANQNNVVRLQVKESEEFRLLPVEQLIEIISSDDLNVRSEEHVYKAVITWMKHDVNERRPLLPKVCQGAAIERELEHNILSLFLQIFHKNRMFVSGNSVGSLMHFGFF